MLFSKQFDLVTAKDSSGVMEELFERLQRHHSHTVSLSECTITPTYDMTAVDEDSPFVEPPQQSFGNDPSASTAASSWNVHYFIVLQCLLVVVADSEGGRLLGNFSKLTNKHFHGKSITLC